MATKKEVEVRDVADLPDLVPTPSVFDEIEANDVAIARVKMGQDTSPPVQAEAAKYGDIYSVMNKEDTNPVMGWEFGKEAADGVSVNADKGLPFLVLDMYRGKSVERDGKLELFDFHSPDAPDDAWVTYNYFICTPTLDDYLPTKLILTRTGRSAAQQINTILKKSQARGPAYLTQWELTAKRTRNEKGRFCIPVVKQVEANPEYVKLASGMAELMAGRPDIKREAANPETDF